MNERSWTITINAPDVWLTANKPKSRWARGPLAAAWRRAAYQTAIAARLPKGLARVRIEPVARFRAGRRPVRDTPNLAPTIKAAIDGLGPQDRGKTAAGKPWIAPGYGLIPDDDDKHLDLAAVVIGDPLPAVRYGSAGELILTICEVPDAHEPVHRRAARPMPGMRCLGYGEQVRSWTDTEAFPNPADLSAERFGLTKEQTRGEKHEA